MIGVEITPASHSICRVRARQSSPPHDEALDAVYWGPVEATTERCHQPVNGGLSNLREEGGKAEFIARITPAERFVKYTESIRMHNH